MKLIVAAICIFVVIWVLMYTIVDTQNYYKCIYNNGVGVYVESKTMFYVDVIYNTGEHTRIPLFFFVHNFELV
jgi:hypothetical protein